MTPTQTLTLASKREKLREELEHFHTLAIRFLGVEAVETISGTTEDPGMFELYDTDDKETVPAPAGQIDLHYPEHIKLPIPSAMAASVREQHQVSKLARKELVLRNGHANDTLQALQLALGQKSFQFRQHLRPAQGKVQTTRAWAAIQSVNEGISHHCRVYSLCRQAMISLGLQETDEVYRPLMKEDVRTSTAVMHPNSPGLSQNKLSWIWTVQMADQERNNYLNECEFSPGVLTYADMNSFGS